MTHWTEQSVAAELLRCEDERVDRPPFTDEWPDLSIDSAYRIQVHTLQARLERGEQLIGVKLGLTSRAKQRTMKVDAPLVAWLTDAMTLETGAATSVNRFIHPRVEPELAVVLGQDLTGPGVTPERAWASVATVHAAAEVIDSRYRDFRFTLPDVIADNASSGAYLTGPVAKGPTDLDPSLEAVLVEVDGVVTDSATGAAILGNPAEALAAAANLLGPRGHVLRAGWVVLLGAMTDAVPVSPGSTVTFHYTNLGSISLPWSD